MARDVERPQLDDVPVGVGRVDGTAIVVTTEHLLMRIEAVGPEPFDGRVIVIGRDVEREVDVRPAAPAGDCDLRFSPEADPVRVPARSQTASRCCQCSTTGSPSTPA